jgi:hypothetical protein
MTKITVAALVAATGSAMAGGVTHTFDISGIQVDGGFGANFPGLTHDFGAAGTVVEVSWDVNYEALGTSWQSEAQMAVDTDDDQSLDADVNPFDFGAADAPGVFSYSGSIAANSISSNGLVYLTLYDSFDDAGIDHVYGAGSSVTVTYIPVPAPAAGAVLGMGGLLVARRRR